jgi:hypothetical protein
MGVEQTPDFVTDCNTVRSVTCAFRCHHAAICIHSQDNEGGGGLCEPLARAVPPPARLLVKTGVAARWGMITARAVSCAMRRDKQHVSHSLAPQTWQQNVPACNSESVRCISRHSALTAASMGPTARQGIPAKILYLLTRDRHSPVCSAR